MNPKRRPKRQPAEDDPVTRKLGRRGHHRLRRLAQSDLAEELREQQRGYLVFRPHSD